MKKLGRGSPSLAGLILAPVAYRHEKVIDQRPELIKELENDRKSYNFRMTHFVFFFPSLRRQVYYMRVPHPDSPGPGAVILCRPKASIPPDILLIIKVYK